MESANPGTVIADRYRLTRPLGTGSSAVVWEAQDTSLDRMVAVKLLHGGAAAHPAGREQLRREALALARLSHPRITTVFDYVEQLDDRGEFQPVLVTELLSGLNLEDRLAQGPLIENDARLACAQLASALEAAHKAGIIHRDLKPGNVMLLQDGVKLLDFGIAQSASDTDATTGMVIGTPSCMAPEQLTGQGALPASDVYALGCVLYWCITGHAPFEAATVDEVVQGHLRGTPPPLPIQSLPPQIAGIYKQCMSKDAAQRPTAGTVAAVLELRAAPAMATVRPQANRTMVMPAYDMPPPPSHTATQQPYTQQIPAQAPPPYDVGYPAQPVYEEPRRISRTAMVVGGLAIAAIAATATAFFMANSSNNTVTGGPTSPSSQSPSSTPSTVPTTPSTPSSTPTSGSTGAPTADPNGDPIGFLEGMKGQVDGFIAQGQDAMDPNAGRNIQNSLSDLEKSVQAAQQNGFQGKKLHDVQTKIDRLNTRINDARDNNQIGDAPASSLLSELQNLSDAVNSHG